MIARVVWRPRFQNRAAAFEAMMAVMPPVTV